MTSKGEFINLAPHTMAVRFYAGELNIVDVTTAAGTKYKLLNLPYFLVTQIEKYLDWFQKQINE